MDGYESIKNLMKAYQKDLYTSLHECTELIDTCTEEIETLAIKTDDFKNSIDHK